MGSPTPRVVVSQDCVSPRLSGTHDADPPTSSRAYQDVGRRTRQGQPTTDNPAELPSLGGRANLAALDAHDELVATARQCVQSAPHARSTAWIGD
jgi:hypothetical protein